MCISESERDKQVQGYAISREVWTLFCKLILKIIVTQKGFNSTLMATTAFFFNFNPLEYSFHLFKK